MDGNPLFIIPKYSLMRKFFCLLLRNKYYDYFIIIVIAVNSIQLALDNPLIDPTSNYAIVLMWIDLVTTIIFILEAIIKILTYGFYYNGS